MRNWLPYIMLYFAVIALIGAIVYGVMVWEDEHLCGEVVESVLRSCSGRSA